jgi:hypothetical protein
MFCRGSRTKQAQSKTGAQWIALPAAFADTNIAKACLCVAGYIQLNKIG